MIQKRIVNSSVKRAGLFIEASSRISRSSRGKNRLHRFFPLLDLEILELASINSPGSVQPLNQTRKSAKYCEVKLQSYCKVEIHYAVSQTKRSGQRKVPCHSCHTNGHHNKKGVERHVSTPSLFHARVWYLRWTVKRVESVNHFRQCLAPSCSHVNLCSPH
jgi:hypothetical protein